eukprot:3956591-Heterocapsa_arctica.AAC.1
MVRARRLLRYLQGTKDFVLRLTGHQIGDEDTADVNVFADANWANGPGRKSTTGGCCHYGGTLVATWSRTQPTVTLSTAE